MENLPKKARAIDGLELLGWKQIGPDETATPKNE
jgi:hypothetical protein